MGVSCDHRRTFTPLRCERNFPLLHLGNAAQNLKTVAHNHPVGGHLTVRKMTHNRMIAISSAYLWPGFGVRPFRLPVARTLCPPLPFPVPPEAQIWANPTETRESTQGIPSYDGMTE